MGDTDKLNNLPLRCISNCNLRYHHNGGTFTADEIEFDLFRLCDITATLQKAKSFTLVLDMHFQEHEVASRDMRDSLDSVPLFLDGILPSPVDFDVSSEKGHL